MRNIFEEFCEKQKNTKKNNTQNTQIITRINSSSAKSETTYRQKIDAWQRRLNRIPETRTTEELRKILNDANLENNTDKKCIINKIHKLINKMKTKEKVLLSYDYAYKFSKSNQNIAGLFYESWYFDYQPGLVVAEKDGHFSFVTDKSILLQSAVFGDQLTRFTFSQEHPDFDEFSKAHICFKDSNMGDYWADMLIVDKNFTLRDPVVIKALINETQGYMPFMFLTNFLINGRKLPQIYDLIEFAESARCLRQLTEIFNLSGYDAMINELDTVIPGNDHQILL